MVATWLDILVQVALSATVTTAVLAAAAYFGKGVFTHYLARALETHKSDLSSKLEAERHELTRDLEQFKRELDALLSERQTRFSLMHQKRADIIAELYGMIPRAEHAMRRMTALMRMESRDKEVEEKKKEEERAEAGKAYNALQDYFDRNRLFLGEQAAKRCEELLSHMRSAFFDFEYAKGFYTQGRQDDKKWVEAAQRITKEIPPVREALEKDFPANPGHRGLTSATDKSADKVSESRAFERILPPTRPGKIGRVCAGGPVATGKALLRARFARRSGHVLAQKLVLAGIRARGGFLCWPPE